MTSPPRPPACGCHHRPPSRLAWKRSRWSRGRPLGITDGAARAGARRPMATPPSSGRSGPRREGGTGSPHTSVPGPWAGSCSRPRCGARGAIEGPASRGGGVRCSHCSCRLLAHLLGDRPVLGLEPLRPERPWSAAPAALPLPPPQPPPAASPHPCPAGAPSTLHWGGDQGSRVPAPVCVPPCSPLEGRAAPLVSLVLKSPLRAPRRARRALNLISRAGLLGASQQSPWVPGSDRTSVLRGEEAELG